MRWGGQLRKMLAALQTGTERGWRPPVCPGCKVKQGTVIPPRGSWAWDADSRQGRDGVLRADTETRRGKPTELESGWLGNLKADLGKHQDSRTYEDSLCAGVRLSGRELACV